MYNPSNTSATAFGVLLCFVWGAFLLGWLVHRSRIVSDAIRRFRESSTSRRIAAALVIVGLVAYGGGKGGDNGDGDRMDNLPHSPLRLQRTELPASPAIAPVTVCTNDVSFRTESANAVEVTVFRRIGGAEIGEWIDADAPFFAIGANPVSRCYVSAGGSVSFESMQRPPIGSAPADGSGRPVLCPFRAPLGMVPEANWDIAGTQSRFWHEALPGGGRVMTWENALVDRLPGRRVSLQVELHPSGDSVFRYDFRDALEPPATNFVMGAQMETDGVNALSIFGTNVIAATVWNVEGEPVADGVSIADLLCTNGVLRTPATFEIRWKNTTGLDPDADTDGDGLTDWTETFLWGTAPDCSDTDGDGIADSVELMMGMNQFDADEDGDGIPDGAAEEDWLANPLWAANATNGVNVVISLNEAVPANAAATLVVGDLAIPLRSPASWTLAFVPGIAYDYRLHVSGDVPVNLSITAGAPPSDLLNAPRPPAAGDADDNDGPPLWEHGKGGVFDGESPGGDGKVAIADISFTWGPSSGETHLTGYGICLHEGSRAGFEPHAVPSEIDEKWELTNLLMENGLFFLDVPNPGAVYTGTASLQSDLLREGRLSADFAAHRCDATSSRPFCSVCSCYVPLDAELICCPRRLTLKYDNFAELSMLHNNSTNVGFSNPRYEIKGPGDTTWTSLPGDNWKARIDGTFLVRGKAEVSGKEITVGPITIWVRFPSETEMIADPAIQAKAAELWSQTLNACTPTSRREFGCWIRLDTGTDTYEFSQTICGDEVSDNRPTGIQLDTPPPDTPIFPHLSHGSAIYTVGSLHTHTPTTYLQEDDPRPAGPSVPDKMTSRSLHMPGIVYDYDEETTGAGIPMGLSMDATAHLYPTGVCPRRNQ